MPRPSEGGATLLFSIAVSHNRGGDGGFEENPSYSNPAPPAVRRLTAEPLSQADKSTAEMLDSENGELCSDEASSHNEVMR